MLFTERKIEVNFKQGLTMRASVEAVCLVSSRAAKSWSRVSGGVSSGNEVA